MTLCFWWISQTLNFPFPLNSQFYIHVTFPNVLLTYFGEEKSTVRMDEKLMTLMSGGWDGEGKEGIKREGRRKKRGCWDLAYDCGGWLWLFGLLVFLETLGTCGGFLGCWEEGSIVILVWIFYLDTHTTSGWTWARRAREPVEVS